MTVLPPVCSLLQYLHQRNLHHSMHHMQVTDKNGQLQAASTQLAESLAQLQTVVTSAASLTDQLASSRQLLSAEQLTSQTLQQKLSESQAERR